MKFEVSQPGHADTQIRECHVTQLPKKARVLMCDPPLPPGSAGHGGIEPKGRHADVADRPDNFCPHVRDPPSHPSHFELHLVPAYDL